MDLEVHEAILVEQLECSLRPPDGQDLSVEMDEARTCVDKTAMIVPPKPNDYRGRSCRLSVSWSTWACFLLRKFPNYQRQLGKSYQRSTTS
jgi:hypothetical protein